MSALHDLIAQRDALNKQIEEANKAERMNAIAKVKGLIAEFGLHASDVFGSAGTSKLASGSRIRNGSKVAPKYRDPISGATWTGRGRSPTWLAGRNKNDFLIA